MSTGTQFILFNGPPGSGKDTAAAAIRNDPDITASFDLHLERCSLPMKNGIAAMFDRTAESLERTKDAANPTLFDYSYRTAQIKLFNWMAETFHPGILGTLLARRITKYLALRTDPSFPLLVLVPDLGRDEELSTFLDYFAPDQLIIIRLSRPGSTFAGDCRSYITPGPIRRFVTIENTSNQNDFARDVVTAVKTFLLVEETV